MTEIQTNGGGLPSARVNGDSDTILAEISFFLLTSQSAYAGSFTYQKDFKRRNGIPINRATYRNKAMEAVEDLILNELTSCLAEEPAVQYFELTREDIKSLAKAILQRNVMEEKWDGQCYYLRARIIGDSANSDAYPAILDQMQGKAKALLDARERARVAIEEVKKLEYELEGSQARAKVLKAIASDGSAPQGGSESWIREGDALWVKGDYARAASAYEAALAHDATSAAAFLGRGAAHFRMNEYQKAVEDFARARKLSPMDVTAHVNLGCALVKTGAHDLALDALNQAVSLDSGSFDGWFNRGVIHLVHFSDADSALRDFTEAIRLRPDDYRAYLHRGAVHARVGRYREAVEDYDRALERNPDFALTYFDRANAAMRQGASQKAIEDYTHLIERFGDHVGGYFNRALAYVESGENEKALSDFDRVIGLAPTLPGAFLCRGILHYRTASIDLACDDWREASKLGDPVAKDYLAKILN